ncbi:heterokaryon incompatibility protein-domain-containing protein [Pisolithus orientalis]|uniref:heterokaryon incompatibility protein-domain-containing protein n=1 Tax=Pisolithus orientalis TaxID=936130 RepID=UPI002225B442|nr:heterokaryon incompatibility protein-domain-containing protein [Pisolithus orientalis]KAI5993783.1 heterokaryon incompatibility protein-domain-containing protein [Pisolithus orientalis]
MKLLDVNAVLDRETHIEQADPEREVLKVSDGKGTRYAILSHRWGADSEVNYKEMIGLMKMEEHKRDNVRQRDGYQKIVKSCEQAMKDGYEWLWIDTCCINKRSSSELSEAINSMHRWYQHAHVCYAYLNDVEESIFPAKRDRDKFGESNGWPVWFLRGWTLQELIAPSQVKFFNKDWVPIGDKRHLAPMLKDITGIPCEVLRDGLAAKRLCVAQIMSWAATRKTERVEDRAYSLMGLFGVHMPMLYGEGKKAFRRLQLEIIRESSDQSIFAWSTWKLRTGSDLADDPSDFLDCGNIEKVTEPDEYVDGLMEYIGWKQLGSPWYIARGHRTISKLRRHANTVSQRLDTTFSVSNADIQVCLPVIPLPDPPSHFRAILACKTYHGIGGLATIDLVFSGSRFHRTPVAHSESHNLKTYPEFKTLYLTHHQDANETRREFTLDDKHASYHGFTRRGTYPRKFTGDTVALSSLTGELIVIVYANDNPRSCFAVGLGYYLGQGWVHVVSDEHPETREDDWTGFGRRACARMWDARVEHALSMRKHEHDEDRYYDHFIKHAHLPRSIWAAKVVWGRWEKDNFKIMVDVDECPGCCDGPHRWATTFNDYGGFQTPGLMRTDFPSYFLELDRWRAGFDECSGQRIALGDYGDYSNGAFMRVGNVFEDMAVLGINTTDSAYCPVVTRVSNYLTPRNYTENWDDLAVAYYGEDKWLALHQSKGLSIPTNEHFVLLLKALSTRLAGKHLVITVVQCSDFYIVNDNGERNDDSAPGSNNHCTEPRVLTPLCTIASPQVWRRDLPCVQRRERFKSIREYFYSLVNMIPSLLTLFACAYDVIYSVNRQEPKPPTNLWCV